MKIFISWSGDRSKAVGSVLNDWIKCVLQATQPFMSARDIDRGSLWFSEISDQLKDTSVGIVCLTQENKDRPWILFESGALAKGLSSNRVCTFLIDLKPADLEDPLAQFNHTLPERDSMWSLVRTLNGCLPSGALDERILDQVFGTYWAQFESQFKAALKACPSTEKAEPRSEKNILTDILDATRSLSHRLRRMENITARFSASPNELVERYLPDDVIRPDRMDPAMARRIIRELVRVGVSTENIITDLAQRNVPRSFVLTNIERERQRMAGNGGPSESSAVSD